MSEGSGDQPEESGSALLDTQVRFLRFGVPQLFTWVEWCTLAAFIQYAGIKTDIRLVQSFGRILGFLIGMHLSFHFGLALSRNHTLIPKGWKNLLLLLVLAVFFSVGTGYGLTQLVAAIVKAQTAT